MSDRSLFSSVPRRSNLVINAVLFDLDGTLFDRDATAELRRRGKRLGIVSNGTALVQNAAIDALGIRDAMDAILISETEGIRKPHADIFHRAASRVGVPSNECCFIGDHPTVDIAGAEAAGLARPLETHAVLDAGGAGADDRRHSRDSEFHLVVRAA